MAIGMQHWNGDQLCAIDIETTGTDPLIHEIIQLAVLALDDNIRPRQDVVPFYIDIAPERPDLAQKEAINIDSAKFNRCVNRGHNAMAAIDLFEAWYKTLKLPYAKYGLTPKRIIPLGQNYTFDRAFLVKWLGAARYDDFFDPRYRDTMTVALYLNDRASMHATKVPFSKVNLAWLAHTLSIERDRAHDALQDCLATAGVYRELLKQGLLG
jgi:DNA polymerase III epsilon subunit-like protein